MEVEASSYGQRKHWEMSAWENQSNCTLLYQDEKFITEWQLPLWESCKENYKILEIELK